MTKCCQNREGGTMECCKKDEGRTISRSMMDENKSARADNETALVAAQVARRSDLIGQQKT